MSNRRRRRLSRADRARLTSDHARWMADRYKPHRAYSAAQLRVILTEDAVARRATPLAWFVAAIAAIAESERTDVETVFSQVRSECVELTGLDMPFAGLDR